MSSPPIALIVLIVGLPILSETVYSPSLPDIAKALYVSQAIVEHTLTIYLFGFALGTFFWGTLSDHIGRKKCVLVGFIIFVFGCLGCYFSETIDLLMFSRFVQAFGGSVGSVLGQAIARDSFHGPKLGKTYSSIGSALAVFPAIGPVIGGFIAEHFDWHNIFLFLLLFATILIFIITLKLPETYDTKANKPEKLLNVISRLLRDRNVVGFGLIVGACNGISFSYFAEGSFYLIRLLGLSQSSFGLTFILIAIATIFGGMLSRQLNNKYTFRIVMWHGIIIMFFGEILFSIFAILHSTVMPLPVNSMICITVGAQMINRFGMCMVISNALAAALVDYKHCIGTASSLFGCFYYSMISLFTFGMGYLHNGTFLPMPLYFLAITVFLIIVKKYLLISNKSVS